MNYKKELSKRTGENGVIKGVWLFMMLVARKIFEHVLIFIYKTFYPINPRLIILRSTPDFSDNARALAEYMVENGYTKRYIIYFDVETPEKYRKKYSDSAIKFFSCKNTNGTYNLNSLRLMYTAGYLMSTHTMILNCYQGRKKQHFVRLWHGCGYKDRSSRDGHSRRNFDVALVPGPLFVKTKAYFWNVDEKYIMPIGYPRYDWLLKKNEKASEMISRFKNDKKSKVILWMPTFRIDKKGRYNETNNLINFPILEKEEDWLMLDKHCQQCNVVLLIKLHPFQKEYDIPFSKFKNIKEITNSDFELRSVQMYSFLALTDALITDYSSVAIDYLLVDKPIGFTLDDYDEYKNARGFIFDNPLEYMPGQHIFTIDNLRLFISDIGEGNDRYSSERKRVRSIAISPSDHYCKDLLDKLGIMC